MPTDNVALNSGSGGATLRTLGDGSSIEWPASVVCYATTVSAGANVLQVVTPSFGMPVAQQGTWTVTTDVTGLVLAQGSTTAGQTGPLIQGACTTAAPTYTTGKTEPLSLDTSGNLRVLVTPSGTQAVSGTVAISGSVAVTGTFWQATQPVSAASLPLPAGAAADSSVNGILVSQGSTTSGEKGPLIQGAVTTSAPSYTTAQTSPLSLDTSGNLRVLATASGTYTVSGTVTASQGGTWNVGTVTTVTTVSAVTAITNALPAGTNLLGQVAQASQIATAYNGTTPVTPQYAAITASASGATTIVAAVAGKKIYILRWSLSANGNVSVNWQSHTTTGNATGLHYMTQYATAGGAYCPAGIFATTVGEALDLNLSASVAVGGELTYVQF